MKIPASYANAVAVSAQKTLIPKSRFLAATEAKTAADALETLTSTGFGKGTEISGAGEYEKLAAAESVALRRFIDEYACADVAHYCFLKSDFFNCDVAVRRAYFGYDGEYLPDGETDVEEIERYVSTGSADVPERIAKVADELIALAGKEDRAGVDFSLVTLKSYYAAALGFIRSPFIRSLIRAEIDCCNISAYFRASGSEAAEKQFISGGKLAKAKLSPVLSGDSSKIRTAFLFTPYLDAIDACIKAKAERRPLAAFEKIRDDYPMSRLYDRRYASEGITPTLLYAVYKRAEIRNFRTVISGKLASSDPEAIAGRLRDGYLG